MKVKNYMTKEVIDCEIDDDVSEVANIMEENNIGFLAVCEDEEIVGVITDRDLVVGPVADEEESIEEYITRDIVKIDKNKEITEALNLMRENKIKRLLVTDKDKYVGVLSISDLFKSDLKEEILETLIEIKD